MNRDKEKRYLNSVLKKINSNKRPIFTRLWFNYVFWVIGGVLFVTGLRLFEKGSINIWGIIIISAVVGAIIGILSIIQAAERNWPILKKYFDQESIKKRIEELDT